MAKLKCGCTVSTTPTFRGNIVWRCPQHQKTDPVFTFKPGPGTEETENHKMVVYDAPN